MAAIRDSLSRRRLTSPLFDTAMFARHLEKTYELMHARAMIGAVPDHIVVPA